VVPAALIFGGHPLAFPAAAIQPLIALTLVTFMSRLTLFAGVKLIGGVQTSLFGLAELLVTILLAQLFLGENLSLAQWAGAGILIITVALAGLDRTPTTTFRLRGWLYWLRSPLTDQSSLPVNGQDRAE